MQHSIIFFGLTVMNVLKERYRKLLEDSVFSDVVFVLEKGKHGEERIEAHKCILSASNTVFSSMFEEAKDKNAFRITDVTPSAFKSLLKYFYTNEYPEIDEDNWASILYAAEKYEIQDLKEKCIEFVKKNCHPDNAIGYFNRGRKHYVDHLVPQVINTIEIHATTCLISDSFLTTEDNELLNEILSLDKLNCDEIHIFRAALRWASSKIIIDGNEELRTILGHAFYAIRFPLICSNDFKDILTDEEIISILRKIQANSNGI